MNYSEILFEKKDGVCRLTLNKPPLNIIGLKMMEEILDAVTKAGTDPSVRVIVVAANGKAFSAGMDILDHTPERAPLMMDAFNRLFFAIERLDCATMAAVDGAALGGGMELVIACDMVIASERAKFGQPEVKLGFFPPLAAVLLPSLAGRGAALEIMLSGEPVPAARARELGMANRVVPVEGFAGEVDKFAAEVARHSGAVIRLCKKAERAARGRPFGEALDSAKAIFLDELMKSQDTLEGLKAYAEKREAQWQDR
ncbi:MAG: enoyl-CoA hydratase/isomerase family protein [Deltaproteobacteria bacterium]|nr:enoyl-CoA hydratase/isomerase family protein [Deltaproteobacteria bacterium]